MQPQNEIFPTILKYFDVKRCLCEELHAQEVIGTVGEVVRGPANVVRPDSRHIGATLGVVSTEALLDKLDGRHHLSHHDDIGVLAPGKTNDYVNHKNVRL